jgi:predicted nucleotidyltransferase
MEPLATIERHLDEIRTFGVRRIGVFGSYARGEATSDSDVDVYVYVEFDDDQRTYDNYFELYELLEKILGRPVDLVTDKALNPSRAALIVPTVRYASVPA